MGSAARSRAAIGATWVIAFVCLTASVGGSLRPHHHRYRLFQSLTNMKQIGLGLLLYTQDYDERLPSLESMPEAKRTLQPYVSSSASTSPELWREPRYGQPYAVNTSLSRQWLRDYKVPEKVVTFYETYPWSGKRVVGFLDGHAKAVSEEDWPRLARESGMTGAFRAADAAPPAPWWSLNQGGPREPLPFGAFLFVSGVGAMLTAAHAGAAAGGSRGRALYVDMAERLLLFGLPTLAFAGALGSVMG